METKKENVTNSVEADILHCLVAVNILESQESLEIFLNLKHFIEICTHSRIRKQSKVEIQGSSKKVKNCEKPPNKFQRLYPFL